MYIIIYIYIYIHIRWSLEVFNTIMIFLDSKSGLWNLKCENRKYGNGRMPPGASVPGSLVLTYLMLTRTTATNV